MGVIWSILHKNKTKLKPEQVAELGQCFSTPQIMDKGEANCTSYTSTEKQVLEKGIKQIISTPTSDLQSKSEIQYLIIF